MAVLPKNSEAPRAAPQAGDTGTRPTRLTRVDWDRRARRRQSTRADGKKGRGSSAMYGYVDGVSYLQRHKRVPLGAIAAVRWRCSKVNEAAAFEKIDLRVDAVEMACVLRPVSGTCGGSIQADDRGDDDMMAPTGSGQAEDQRAAPHVHDSGRLPDRMQQAFDLLAGLGGQAREDEWSAAFREADGPRSSFFNAKNALLRAGLVEHHGGEWRIRHAPQAFAA